MKRLLRILLLVDKQFCYKLIIQELKKLEINHTTEQVTAQNTFEAAIKQFKPDIILSNYKLENYSGLSALTYSIKNTPLTPFIFVNESLNEEIIIDCIKAGATDYVSKSNLSQLTHIIKKTLDKKNVLIDPKLSALKLLENYKMYKQLYKNSTDPILIFDDSQILDCNETGYKALNYESKAQLLSKKPSDLSPEFQPDGKRSSEKSLEMMGLVFQNGNHNFEWVNQTKDEIPIWFEVSVSHMPALGKYAVCAICRDITERKTAEITQKVIFNISEASATSDSLETLSQKIHIELGEIIDNSNFYIVLYDETEDVYNLLFHKDKYESYSPGSKISLSDSITDYVRKDGKSTRITDNTVKKLDKVKLVGRQPRVWIGAPLTDTSTNKIIGVVAIQNYEDVNALSEKDVDLLTYVARNIGTAIARKKSNITINESEERYRRLFEDSFDPILIVKDYEYVDCNDATIKFLNCKSKSDFLSNRLRNLSPEFQPDKSSSKKKALEMMNIAIKNGNHNFEWVYLTKDKKEVWVDVSFTHIPTLGKKGLYTIWRDITDKKNAEITQEVLFNISESSETSESLEVLSENIHKELGKIIDNTNFYIALFNTKKNTYTFPFYKDKYDSVSPDEELDLTNSISDYVRKKGKAIRITEAIERELNKKKKIKSIGIPSPVWIGAPLIDVASEKIIGIIAAQNYEDENALTNKDVDLLAFVARNIGTAIARKRTEIAINESEDQFRSLAQTATDGIIIFDNIGNVIFLNNAATRILQYKPNEVIGTNFHKLLSPKKNNQKAHQELEVFFKTDNEKTLGKMIEVSGKRKDGSTFPIELSVSKFKKDEKWHTTGFIRDITQRKEDEKELKKAKEKAEESDRLKTAFLANMSHEIRTPMNAILGFSELLSLDDLSNEERGEFVKLIQNNSNSLLNLINDIIDIAKIESGQLQILIKEFDIDKELEDILRNFEKIKINHEKEHIKFALNTPNYNQNLVIISDQNRINQVVSNLLGNALKYTKEGEIEFGYKIISQKNKDFIQFFIKDSGIGIPKNKIDVIFDRFRQADDTHTRTYGGFGLGLAISQNIAKLINGIITVESIEGTGSTFYITIPLKISKTIQYFEKEETEQKASLTLEGRTILIAEDVESNFQLLQTYLSRTKVNIVWAKNGQEAVNECRENPSIDIVLMDMQMPVLNGYQATQEIKTFRSDLPIIAVTAFALAGDQEKILEAGCDFYISKPLKVEVLFETIKKYL